MAGVNTVGDEGREVGTQTVPSIDPSGSATVAASAHLSDANRADGVAYPENSQVDVTTKAYPAGTAMNDTTPGDDVN